MDNMSLSDIAAVTRGTNDNDGWGGNGAWWIIILFLFALMGGGLNGWNRQGEYGQYATAASQQEILYGQQFGQINDRLTNLGNGVCNLGYEMQGGLGQLGKDGRPGPEQPAADDHGHRQRHPAADCQLLLREPPGHGQPVRQDGSPDLRHHDCNPRGGRADPRADAGQHDPAAAG